jgi:Ca2+-binding RTX toxin-like protein
LKTTVGETLIRTSGADKRYGTLGDDAFLFDVAPGLSNADEIVDFDVTHDAIHLDATIFTALAVGSLSAGALRIGSKATDSNDRIIYNNETGILSYDADGSGNGASVQIARLAADLKMAASNFHVV